ncbi:hypothetical protein [Streptomyces massasporeus]|uniref:hypothetical protein n=1 Tax=Streptomyces massasporeus TaxID=67324 RepID=UPI0036947AE0
MGQDEALQLAVAFLAHSQRDEEPPLAIDAERVRESNGLLIVPYNSVQYLASSDAARDGLVIGINWNGPRLVGWSFTPKEVLNRLATAN